MSILTAVDIDQVPEQPITIGYDLAATYDETLVVMYVMSEEEFDRMRSSREELPPQYREGNLSMDQAINSAAERVAGAVDDALDTYEPERVESRGRIGAPADEILTAAEELDPRFVVVGGRKRSAVRQAIFGSVSQAIVRNAEQPVVTVMEETG